MVRATASMAYWPRAAVGRARAVIGCARVASTLASPYLAAGVPPPAVHGELPVDALFSLPSGTCCNNSKKSRGRFAKL
jgi:hypothetical protein